jgi:hypothetical protein
VLAVVVELSTEQLAAAHGAAATKHSAEAMAELTPDKLSYCRSLNRKLQRRFFFNSQFLLLFSSRTHFRFIASIALQSKR